MLTAVLKTSKLHFLLEKWVVFPCTNTKFNIFFNVLLINRRKKVDPVLRTNESTANVASFYSPNITSCMNQFVNHSEYTDKEVRPTCEYVKVSVSPHARTWWFSVPLPVKVTGLWLSPVEETDPISSPNFFSFPKQLSTTIHFYTEARMLI